MTPKLILLMSPAKDLRHIGKNLSVLRPEKQRLETAYRQYWVSGALGPIEEWGQYVGEEALLVFFDYGSRMLAPVRMARVAGCIPSQEHVNLSLELGAFVRLERDAHLDVDAIPKDAAMSGKADRLPQDGKAHSFVFAPPPEWAAALGTMLHVNSLSAWASLVSSLLNHPGGPFSTCTVLHLAFGSDMKSLPVARVVRMPNADAGELPISLMVVQNNEAAESIPVTISVKKNGKAFSTWAYDRGPGSHAVVSLPGLRGGSEMYEIEAFSPAHETRCTRCNYVVESSANPSSAPDPDLWLSLFQIAPEDANEKRYCRRLFTALRASSAKGIVELLDLGLEWELEEAVEDLLGDAPDLLDQLTSANLASTLPRSRDMVGPHRMFAREALRRLTGNQELSNRLFLAYVKSLENLPPERFWECFDLGQVYAGGAEREYIDVGFLWHADAEGRLQAILDMIERNLPPPPAQAPHVVHLFKEQGGAYAHRAGELEMRAWKDSCAWVRMDRIVESMPWAQLGELVDCLDQVEPDAIYGTLRGWYLKNRPGGNRKGPASRETDLVLWLYEAAGEGAADDRALWLERLVEIALAGNPHLLFWLWGKRPEMPAALRERVERHLDERTVQSVTEELEEQLAGLKVFVTGYEKKIALIDDFEKIGTVEWTFRELKKGTKLKKGDIKKGIDCAIIFRWISHPCMETVIGVIPRHLFVDGIPPGRVFEFLKEVAAEKASKLGRAGGADAASQDD
jgi:hypothetical protein